MPHSDGGEFVNVGVALVSCRPRTLVHRIDPERMDRVKAFFPETGVEVFRKGAEAVAAEFDRIGKVLRETDASGEFVLNDIETNRCFAYLTRAHEGLFHYSPIRTVHDRCSPSACVDRLYATYVTRDAR